MVIKDVCGEITLEPESLAALIANMRMIHEVDISNVALLGNPAHNHFIALSALHFLVIMVDVRVQKLFVAVGFSALVANNTNAILHNFIVVNGNMVFHSILSAKHSITIATGASEM